MINIWNLPGRQVHFGTKKIIVQFFEVKIYFSKSLTSSLFSQLGDKHSKIQKVETISTGILTLDDALGCGGFPFGRIVEIFGPEASGKTSYVVICLKDLLCVV